MFKTKKPKVLLVNPFFRRQINGQTPLNLAYLAAAIEKDAEVKIIDLNLVKEKELFKTIKLFNPNFLGMSRYTPNNIETIKLLKKVHDKYHNLKIIIGGPHEIYRGNITKIKYPWIDYIVRDKFAEQKFLEIITNNKNKKIDWETLFPAYDLLDMTQSSYRFDNHIFPKKKMLQYMTARGCNFCCSFCPSGNYNPLPIKIVIEQLEKIIKMNYNAVFFNDVNFVANSKRTKELLNEIIKKGINKKLEWGCQTTAVESLSDEIIKLMSKAGCTYITYSLENVSKEALKKINKPLDPKVVKHKCEVARKNNMKIGLYVMFGIFEDCKKDFYWAKKTLDYIEKIMPEFVSYSILAEYPNSNPNLDYESKKYGSEKIWLFFDEGCANHPNCDVKYAKKLKSEIIRRHKNQLKSVIKF